MLTALHAGKVFDVMTAVSACPARICVIDVGKTDAKGCAQQKEE